MVGDTASDGIPLLTRILLVRATAHFNPSFPSDAHRLPPSPPPLNPGEPPEATKQPYAVVGGFQLCPRLRIVAHYAQSNEEEGATSPCPLCSATTTPEDDADFFALHAPLHQLLASLATDRLKDKVKMRQMHTGIARTAVKLARATADSSAAPPPAAGPPDAVGFPSASMACASSTATPQRSGCRVGAANMEDLKSEVSAGSGSSSAGQGIVTAATATFAEDVAWRSLTTPYQPQLNPWCLMPVSDEGCYLSLPSPGYVHWCHQQAARCCSPECLGGGSAEADVQGIPMQYMDTVHYSSESGGRRSHSSGDEELGYVHGYAFILDGAVFAESDTQKEAAITAERPLSDDDGQVSVLLWCVLSDAPVFNFMRSLTLEIVAAMSHVAQRTYHASAESASSRSVESGTGVPTDVYTKMLDGILDEEVVRPLAAALLLRGSVSSRTLPGENFTVNLPLVRGRLSDASAPLQTSSKSGALTFRRPLDLLFPFADVPLSVLLLSFGEDALRVLMSLLMQEERVVVIGATPQHASACVVSLLSLIAPFTWVSPLVPYVPPHTAAQTGLLYILLSTPYGLRQQDQRQSSAPMSSPPAPYSSGVASQASQQTQSAGFLIGSTAGIRPYLMFLSAFGVREESGGRVPRSGRPPRVWIADARTGAVAVCPTEPISQHLLADGTAQHASGADDSDIGSGRSCTAHGGASAWTLDAQLDLRAAVPQMYSSSSPNGGAQNPYVLYSAVRNTLRAAAALNVMDAAPLDVLPPFHDELCDVLRRVAPVEKRRQFRQALEELARHTRVRVDNLASLAARLTRGLQQTLKAYAASADAMRFRNFSVGNSDSSSDINDSSSDSASGSEDDLEERDRRTIDENASFRAVTEAVAQSRSLAFPDPSSSRDLAQFPALSSADTWQVQSCFLGYVVERLAGAYRRGITMISGAAAHHRSRRSLMQASAFLVSGLDQHYGLAETVARTHLFRHFKDAVLEAETLGLRRVLGGCGLQIHAGSSSSNSSDETGGRSGVCHATMKYVRPLAMFAILCDRARLQYPELFADVSSLDAVGMVYATLVRRCFTNRPGQPAAVAVPCAIRSIVGSNASSDPRRTAVVSSSGSSGGGGFRSFLSKAAKAMKLHGGSSAGGGGGGRGLPVQYIPASVACRSSFAVAPFSARHATPKSLHITGCSSNGPSGKPRRHHHNHPPDLHAQRHTGERKSARRRRNEYMANLSVISAKPQRQQWTLQQQHQQRTAINVDFTLDDCTGAVRNPSVPGDVSGPTSSISASSSAAAAARGEAPGTLHRSMYVSGVGLDAELLTAVARTGGARGGNDAAMRMMAEASLSICHTLTVDIVHQFDAYEPLLAPVLVPSAAPASVGSAAAVGVAGGVTSPAAYMGVGLLCPSCINMWREGEVRATRVLQEQRQPPKRNHCSTVSLAPTPAPVPSLPSQPLTGSAVAAAGGVEAGVPPDTPWGAFTSGTPIGFPIDNTPCSLPASSQSTSSANANPPLPSVGWGNPAHAVLPSTPSTLVSTPATLLTAAVSPTSTMPQPSAHRDVWENWGMQAPVVMSTPNAATASAPAAAAATASAGARNPSNNTNLGIREMVWPMPSTLALPSVEPAPYAPAPGDVMDELFAGLPNYNNGASVSNYTSNTSSALQQQQQQPRRQALDDFF